MALEIKLNQKLSQSLVMTPQLQQAIKLLQLGRLEYREMIEKELLENPILEEDPEQAGVIAALGDVENTALNLPHGQNTTDDPEAVLGDSDSSPLEFSDSMSFDSFSRIGSSSSADGISGELWYPAARRLGNGDELPGLESTVQQQEGLSHHLMWQLRTMELTDSEMQIAAQIIGNLDRNGYLGTSLVELAQECRCELGDIEAVLTKVQSLDPPGIAARDLRECLLIQLDQNGLSATLPWRIVERHLELLENQRMDVIAKSENVPIEDVLAAVKEIQRLEPRPGRPFVDEPPVYITPDVYVRKIGDEYVVTLNEAGIPRLRINDEYQALLSNPTLRNAPGAEYLQEKLKSATWLIRSIHQRQQTIYRITESIMKFQRDFLEQGIAGLKPLVLRDIAEDVGMHESTVSRVTTNKYVHTPQGVYELKYFFSSGLRCGDSEVSSETVKEKIRQLVAKEDPKKPLSDQALVKFLEADGIHIARRTVAKYREMMNILSSSRRRRLFT